MSKYPQNNKTLLPRLPPGVSGAIMSALLALGAVALIAVGVGMIFLPAGVITAGVGIAWLQWFFFSPQ